MTVVALIILYLALGVLIAAAVIRYTDLFSGATEDFPPIAIIVLLWPAVPLFAAVFCIMWALAWLAQRVAS